MQCVDHKMRQIDEVPTNSLTKEIATEVPIRMNVVLPPCKVVLHRLTDKEIYQCYPNTDDDSAANKAVYYNEHNYSQSAVLEKDPKKYKFRELPKKNSEYFALYKRKRKNFIDRRYGISVNSNSVLIYSDDSNTDMSEDEFKSQSIQGKGKKRLKKGKYEIDSPWSPNPTKIQSGKRLLRRQVRRPVIDSDSSITDDEEILCNSEVSGDSNSTSSAFQSTVPSDDNNGLGASSFNKIPVCKDSLDDNTIYPENIKDDNEDIILNANSLSSTSENLDIVSGIIQQMNNCAGIKNNLKSLSSGTVNRMQNQNYIKPKLHKRRKITKPCDESTNSIVNDIVKGIINKICIQHKPPNQSNKKFFKKCVWCHTQFSSSKASETMCVICYDQGKGKYVHSPLTKNKNSKGQRQLSGNKLKKISSTMCRVLKKLPKTEMQRLMYVEKSGKLSNEKGYNHCKSFISPKTMPDIDVSGICQEAAISKNINNTDQGKNNTLKNSILTTKKQMSVPNLDTDNNVNSVKSNSECKSDLQRGTNITNSKTNKEKSEAISEKRNKISLKKFNEGLFVMSFPEPDEELNINITGEHLNAPETVKQTNTENSIRLNGSRAAKPSDKSVKQSKNPKQSPSVVNSEEYKTFLLPPVSTIVIANYSNKNDKDGNYRLSTVFYQNQYTLQHANTNCTKNNGSFPDLPKPPSCSISNENLSPNLQNNGSLPVSTTPLNNNVNQIQPFINNPSSLLIASSAASNTIALLPVVSSVISLSERPCQVNKDKSPPFPVDNNFVNSEQLPFKITHVISENTLAKNMNSCIINNKNADKISPSSESSEIIKSNEEISFEKNSAKLQNISVKRKSSSENKKKARKENSLSDTDISENSKEAITLSKNNEVNVESINGINKRKVINIAKKQDKNISDSNKNSLRPEQNISTNRSSKNNSKFIEENFSVSESSENEQNSNVSEHTGGANLNSEIQSIKLVESDENTSVTDPINTTIDLLGAISILGVIDFERNPLYRLTVNMEVTKERLTRLSNKKTVTPEVTDGIASAHYNLKVFEIAYKYLTMYGSFTKVTEHFMRKHKLDEMIQIKKERINDDDEDEEDANQSSCRFSQKSQTTTQLNTETFSNTSETISPSPLTLKMENVSSCSLKEQDSALSHLEKLQSQIAAMNNAQVSYDTFPSGGTVHHYAVCTPAVNAPAPVTPRNDCMGGESRETPSRGSGPRTPARPESATSQPDEQSFALQVKREHCEVTAASPIQHSYTQNSKVLSTQIYDRMSSIRDVSLNPGAQSVLSNALQQISVNGTVNQVYTTQTNFKLQSKDVATNRDAIAYNNSNKQSCTNVLLNIAAETQAPNVTPNMNTNIDQSGQVLFGPPLYISNGTGIPQEQAVPSINNNQYVIQQPFSAPNVLVNSSQVSSQNVNALLTNVSNQQFYTNTTNQVPPLYYPPQTSQITCTQNAMQAASVSLIQNQPTSETMEQMYCAVCKKLATLRCKQCAKVAYCNTICAKTYWHQKHKMECKPLPS